MSSGILLERAARSAGYPWDKWVEDGDDSWNSLLDNDDAMQLMVDKQISLTIKGGITSTTVETGPQQAEVIYEYHGTDPAVATRKVITRAAAATYQEQPS